MSVESLLQQRRLDEALVVLQDEIRSRPADASLRVCLFSVLCTLGQWDRAGTQLAVAKDLSQETLLMVEMYSRVLQCERMRADVFAGQRTPLLMGEPNDWTSLMISANQIESEGGQAKATDTRLQSLESAPEISGQIDGEPFDWIADVDIRMGPMFEAIVDGKYFWIPMDRVRVLEIEPPRSMCDMIWATARFTWVNGGQAMGMIPTRYPGSENCDDPSIRMAHATDWKQVESSPDHYIGIGQRTFGTSSGYYRLLDTRNITLDTNEVSPGEQDG